MMEKKRKEREEVVSSNSTIVVDPPSPPSRHEKWKEARKKKNGDYISQKSQMIAERIESLVEQSAEGSFVSQGRQDILTTAIGKPKHPGLVRGVGQGIGIRQYFGKLNSHSYNSGAYKDMAEMRQAIKEEVIQELRASITHEVMEQFNRHLESLGLSQANPTVQSDVPPLVRVSTKGICAAPSSPISFTVKDGDQCELYVGEKPIRLVAIGRVVNEGPTIHGKPITDDLVRVVVEDAHDSSAPVLVPTE